MPHREIETVHSIPSLQKELAVIPKVPHMSLYSQKTHLEIAGEAAARFVGKYLVGDGAARVAAE